MSNYQYIKQGNIFKKFRESLNMSQKELAFKLDLPQPSVSSIEKGKKPINHDILNKIANHYPDINIKPFITGEEGYKEDTNNILVADPAHAGYGVEFSQENLSYSHKIINIPGITGEARTFEVNGDSMFPILYNGDWLVCTRRIEDFKEIKDNKVYAVVSKSSGITIKFLHIANNLVSLIPFNKQEYQTERLPLEEINEIWEGRLKITKHIIQSAFNPHSNTIQTKVNLIERFLEENNIANFIDWKKQQDK